VKTADKADWEKTWHLLNINQGKDNSADFYVTVRANGEDIKDGGTEPGASAGYLGGTYNSNASVTFKARPGAHDAGGNATVRLLLGGTNVPPRKNLKSSGWLGGGGPEANKDYKVQRFGGAVKFFANKDAKPQVERLDVGPDKAGGTQSGDTGDTKQPLVTVSLNPSASGSAPPKQESVPAKAAAPATPGAKS
jgi:hypothetical protein